jgi:ubiquinone/menaquinone biosynthesis C-methylase UbiE
VHAEAVTLLPEGEGRTWLDIGCGPGLVARLAATRGYHAQGRDIDSEMVELAQRIAQQDDSAAEFITGGILMSLPNDKYMDVVSASSLLFVLDDRATALRQMLMHLKQNGVLLIIESTSVMKPVAAMRWLKQAGYTKRAWMLLLWAWVRSGRAVSQEELSVEGWYTECKPLMGGLIAAWLYQRQSKVG